ncbi:hypothetical protein KP509_11G092700 [Ceratopteris richardii]|uniref:Zinc finger CCCH domain-containing protein 18 n=1 Tax=Ceratopteris richardii TaxID=49495 RepID=A0A8T2TXE8_CERRI|nr:hypothetical protein KP509_11G092700 [Ceratopteris richardii]
MGSEDDEELSEAMLEQQIQEHLIEHRASLSAVIEALACDPHNQELLEVHEELSAALKSAEESLLHLKKNRLLQEIDLALDVKAHEVDTAQTISKAETSDLSAEAENPFPIGSKCRFRHANGRWYYGQILEADDEGFVRVSFLMPTTEKMQMCKYFMQQRCRFGESCRMSHVHSLKEYDLSRCLQPCVGSAILACSSADGEGLWRQAELESWDESVQTGTAVFVHDGSRLDVGIENLSLSQYAHESDDTSCSSEDDEDEAELNDEEDEEDNDYSLLGLGVMEAVEAGPQVDTRVFANWERHTRGIASKMMANMGYREGMGLGKTGQGIVLPVEVRVLPKHRSLDFINKGEKGERGRDKKKKSRGGKRKRYKKLAEAARAAKAEEDNRPDVFGFINNQLATHAVQVDGRNEDNGRFGSGKLKNERQVKLKTQGEDREALVAKADEIAEIRNKVEKLEEMVRRNRKDKAFHEAIARRLEETRMELMNAEQSHAFTSFAIQSKEKEKRWLKF